MNNKKQPVGETQMAIAETPQNDAEHLIAMAIDKNIAVESLERLLAMRDKIRSERAKESFDRAMASFQAECPTIEKRVQGYNYKYADLTAIVGQVKDLLSKNGFSYTFDTDEAENAVIVYCKVKHIGGHMEVSKTRIKNETTSKMNASQQSGAAMTYGKRYAFVNAFGILTGDEDTDAQTPHHQQRITTDYATPSVREENGLTYEQTDQVQPTEAADIYAGKSIAALKVEISQLMHKGKIEKDFAKLGSLSKEEAIEILEGVK